MPESFRLVRYVVYLCAAAVLSMPVPVHADLAIGGDAATPEYWLQADGDRPILTLEEIAEVNRRIAEKSGGVHDLTAVPAYLPGADVQMRIRLAAQDLMGETLPGLYAGGQPLSAAEWNAVRENRALNAVGATVDVRYAIALERANIRLLPTAAGWYESPDDTRYDSLQGTVIDPGEAVLVLHTSRDGAFAFVETRDYYGWVAAHVLAQTDRKKWEEFAAPQEFCTAMAPRVQVSIAEDGRIYHSWLYQLGAKIPIGSRADGSRCILLPMRGAGGRLHVQEFPMPGANAVAEGRLPLTHNNLIRLAFLPLGMEYGWGGANEGMDCSSYVQNIYRAMGIELPRDADLQEKACTLVPLTGLTREERYRRIAEAPPGALLFRPGHVMLYLGQDAGGTPLVIHDISSYYEGGEKQYIRKVVVSHLDFLNARGAAAIDTLDAIGLVVPAR